MKKLSALMLGAAMVLSTAAFAAQANNPKPATETTKTAKKHTKKVKKSSKKATNSAVKKSALATPATPAPSPVK